MKLSRFARISVFFSTFFLFGILFLVFKPTEANAACADRLDSGCWSVTLVNDLSAPVNNGSYVITTANVSPTSGSFGFISPPPLNNSRTFNFNGGTCPDGKTATIRFTVNMGGGLGTKVISASQNGSPDEAKGECSFPGTTVKTSGNVTPPTPPPACGSDVSCPPTNLTWELGVCQSRTTYSVTFRWDGPSYTYPGLTGYRINIPGAGISQNASSGVTFNLNHMQTFAWSVDALFSNGRSSRGFPSSNPTTRTCDPPLTQTTSFTYTCQNNIGRQVDANLTTSSATDGFHPVPTNYIIYRSNAQNGSYSQIDTDTNSTYTDSVTTTGSNPPPNYFYKVAGYYWWRYNGDQTFANNNVGQGQPTNAPVSSYNNTPSCGANYSVSPDVLSVNIPATYANDDRDFNITVPGNPGASNIQGNVRVYLGKDQATFNLSDMAVCQNNFFALPASANMPNGVTFKCQNSPFNPLVSPLGGTMQIIVHTNNVAQVGLGDHKFRVFVCDNFTGSPTHYRLKYNNRTDGSVTGTYSETAPDNCHYTSALTITVLTSPWIKISGGDVGAKTGPIALAPAPSGNYNYLQNRYGKMAVISGGGISPDPLLPTVTLPSTGAWPIRSYSPRLQVGDSSANFYSALKGATIASKVPCDSCQNSNRLPTPGEDTVYQTNGFQLNTVSGAPSHKIVIFVNGSLTINTNIPNPSGNDNGVIFIVSGDVTIANDVTTLYAAIVADGKIDINGATATTDTLNFFGTLAGSDGVNFNRDLPSDQDAAKPILDLVYDSRYVQNFQNLLGTTSATNWQEVAP